MSDGRKTGVNCGQKVTLAWLDTNETLKWRLYTGITRPEQGQNKIESAQISFRWILARQEIHSICNGFYVIYMVTVAQQELPFEWWVESYKRMIFDSD